MSNSRYFDINTAIPADMEAVNLTHTEKRPTHNQISVGFNSRGSYVLSIRNVELKDGGTSYILDHSGKNYLHVGSSARFSAKTLETIKKKLEIRAEEISKHWNEHGLDIDLKAKIVWWVKA